MRTGSVRMMPHDLSAGVRSQIRVIGTLMIR